MKKTRCIALVVLLIGFCSYFISAQERGAFAPIGVGAKAASMGGAFSSLADDLHATYWNPAGLVNLEGGTFAINRVEPFGMGVNYDYLAYGQKFNDIVFAVSNHSLDAGAAFETFNYKENTLVLSMAKNFSKFAAGANLKLYRLEGGNEALNNNEQGFGLDLASIVPFGNNYQMGIVVRDLLSKVDGKLHLEGEEKATKTEISPDLTIGVSYLGKKTTVCLDVSEFFSSYTPHLGVEYQVANNLKLRAGYKPKSIAVGFGISKGMFVFDYAYLTHELKDEQRLSVGFLF